MPERPHRMSRLADVPDPIEGTSIELMEAIAIEDAPHPSAPRHAPRLRPLRKGTDRGGRWTAEERAAAYLDACEPSVSGSGGHVSAIKAAMVGPAFDLSPEATFRLLSDRFNPRCVPPWSDRELDHKVSEAFRTHPRRGWLL